MLCPDDFTVPENEILEKEDELVAKYRGMMTEFDLGEAVTESTGETRDAILRALAAGDSAELGQACTVALFNYIREQLVAPDLKDFIEGRKEQMLHDHEERIHRRASGE